MPRGTSIFLPDYRDYSLHTGRKDDGIEVVYTREN